MLKVLYTAGPGNAFETFRKWKSGERDLTVSHVAYSRQMLEACEKHNVAARITCTCGQGEEQRHGNISIERRPDPTWNKSGLGYHRGVYEKARQNIRDAIEFGADIVVIAEDTNPAHYLSLRRRGVQIVQALHTRLWREDRPPSVLQRLQLLGFRKAYTDKRTLVLSSSDIVSGQVEKLTGPGNASILEFLPLYFPEHYAGLPVAADSDSFEILFIGRVEENKGALDLVRIASRLASDGVSFRFRICGVGSASERMQQMVEDLGLSSRFVFHGWCDRDALRKIMSECHVSIVPTRSDFIEGFNHVVVESVLSGRPVVASSICPAVNYVGDAVRIVQADDLDGYVAALEQLSNDPALLRRQREACTTAGLPFMDEAFSFGAAIDEVFSAWIENRPVRQHRISPGDLTQGRGVR